MSESQTPNSTLPLTLRYQQPSQCHQDHVSLFAQLERNDVSFQGTLKKPLLFREAMATLFAVVSSDFRYVPKDRAAYLAFQRMRRSTENQGLLQAQRAYFDWLLRNDPLAWAVLDPVITVAPDQVLFEVFSKDEGCYALLAFDHDAFQVEGTPQLGTTNIDFSEALAKGIEQIRSGHQTQLSIGQQAVAFETETAPDLDDTEVLEKSVQIPASWIRGLLQVQSATQLPAVSFQLKPIDLYNALHHLRMHKDIKGKRRGLRIELTPGDQPLLVLEPNDTIITASADPFKGKQAQTIRLWGRRRLALLKRFLPYTDSIEVNLLGNGMPSTWVLKGKGVSLSLAVTGFTNSNWSQAINFDLLLPRDSEGSDDVQQVVEHLQQAHQGSLAQISKATSLSKKACTAALQQACQQGLVMFDVAKRCYRHRPLMQEPLDMEMFQFRRPVEKQAYDLATRQKAISKLQARLIPGVGSEIQADVQVKEDRRSYLARLTLNEEGHVAKAECSCHQILQHGLSQGPCAHLAALRIAYAKQQAERKPQQITQETRNYARRRKQKEELYRLTLNQKRLTIEWEKHNTPRQQQFAFNDISSARAAYLAHIQRLEGQGFMDITQ